MEFLTSESSEVQDLHAKGSQTLQKSLLAKSKGKGKGKSKKNMEVSRESAGAIPQGFFKGDQLVTGPSWQQAVQARDSADTQTVFGTNIEEY